ncbi:hypothetical protein I553_6888 [Mycobacterium xenopi 4042]|uniref:Uncharacterized protein n=1 Tax=Mycobacterium xenopi 4042 TaxID=1299334 RepID=X7Z375_MYCXE|nr:hypothetical protein I553_6888 [Mycobacterium xenopi 4042]
MKRLCGASTANSSVPEGRCPGRLLRQCAQALAAIHRADPSGVELDTQDQLAEWRRG